MFPRQPSWLLFSVVIFIKLKKEINKLKRKRKTMANTEVNTR